MAITYFGDNKYWTNITREERLFCSHLYHKIIAAGPERFIEWLNGVESPVLEFKNNIHLNPLDHWQAGYEVCFYRDLLKSYGHGVKESLPKLMRNPSIGTDAVNLIKRTFDLALFSNDTIVIIEAKAASGLNSKQFQEFEMDARLIEGVFQFLNMRAPTIVFLVLAAGKYYSSPSFTSPNGVGRSNIIQKSVTNECKIHGLVSWEQLADSPFSDPIYQGAINAYGK